MSAQKISKIMLGLVSTFTLLSSNLGELLCWTLDFLEIIQGHWEYFVANGQNI